MVVIQANKETLQRIFGSTVYIDFNEFIDLDEELISAHA